MQKISEQEARVMVAELLGWERNLGGADFDGAYVSPEHRWINKRTFEGRNEPPQYLTNAKDDYEVLEWVNTHGNLSDFEFSDFHSILRRTCLFEAWDYKKGDYIRTLLAAKGFEVVSDEK